MYLRNSTAADGTQVAEILGNPPRGFTKLARRPARMSGKSLPDKQLPIAPANSGGGHSNEADRAAAGPHRVPLRPQGGGADAPTCRRLRAQDWRALFGKIPIRNGTEEGQRGGRTNRRTFVPV